ncbi:PREDICTED: microcephalin [Nanorana parkeri]|uniref:microcephalin n=1 Tax=Nanorana parkeri TaxID=125878 RepID=UPI000854EC64|nr:PREDICTED: microcephalin [Nanorana parkeri]
MEVVETLSPAYGAGSVLTGVTAYVEVWSSSRTENYSQSFIEQLLNLGAKVTKRLNKQVTHVVFKDGSQSTWDKAVKSGVKLVSVLWVDKCREAAAHVDESAYSALNPNEGLPHLMRKKRKCMQPKDLVIKTPENDKRLARKYDKMLKELEEKKASVDVPTLSFDDEGSLLFSPVAVIADRSNAMEKRLQQMKDARENLSPTASQMSQTAFDFSCSKPSLENTPSVLTNSSHENNGNMLDTSYDELFGSLEKRDEIASTSSNKETDDVQGETNLHLDCITLFPLKTKASTSSPGVVKKRNSGSRNQRRGRKSQVILKMIDASADDSGSDVFSETPTGTKKDRALDSRFMTKPCITNTDVDCTGQFNVSPFTETKGCKSYSPKAADCITNKDYESDSFGKPDHKKTETSSLESPCTANRLIKMCKNKGRTRRSSCLDLESEVLSTKKSIIKELSKSNLSLSNVDSVVTVSDYDDFFSSNEVKSNQSKFSRFSLTLKPQRSPSPPPLSSNKNRTGKRRRSTNVVQQDLWQAKQRRTIHAFVDSNSRAVKSPIQESSMFPTAEKKDASSPNCLILNAVESSLKMTNRVNSAETHLLTTKSNGSHERLEHNSETSGNMASESSPSNGLKKDANAAMSNGIKKEVVFKEGLSLTNGLAPGEHGKQMISLQQSPESRTSGSDAIAGLSKMFNEQRNKCTKESRKTEKSRKVTRSLVMTSMSAEKQSTIIQVVKNLGGFIFSDSVCESTSHVVSGSARRTLNVILGIARGCWILSYDWILWSLECGQWVPEEPYELSEHFPGAPICRLQRHLSGGEYYQDFLSSMSPLFISPSSDPPSETLSEMVQLCGGKVCKTLRQAKICIGVLMGKKPADMMNVSEKWLLDSITQHKLFPPENYMLQSEISSVL